MKVFNETDRILYYMNRDYDEMITLKFNTSNLDKCTCDSCNKEQDLVYISPFLMDRQYCMDCAKSPLYNVKFNIAESQKVYNDLIQLALRLSDELTDLDYNLINRFFATHSSRHIDIHKFIQKGD